MVATKWQIETKVPAKHAIGGKAYWHPYNDPPYRDHEAALLHFEKARRQDDWPIRLVRIETYVEQEFVKPESAREGIAK